LLTGFITMLLYWHWWSSIWPRSRNVKSFI